VQTKIPSVSILEEAFDFGKLTTLGNPGVLPLTLVNQSAIAAVLIIDLRDSEKVQGPDCLDIEFLSSSNNKCVFRAFLI